MKAVYYEEFAGPVSIKNVPDPSPQRDGVVLQVKATGICRRPEILSPRPVWDVDL